MMNQPLGEMMDATMDKIRTMVEANTVIGTPITTADGSTAIPLSRISYGFACGGNDTSESPAKPGIWGGSGAGIKVEPMGVLMIREGNARLVGIQPPAFTTADRLLDMVPDVLDRVEKFAESHGKKPGKHSGSS